MYTFLQEMDSWYRSKFLDLSNASNKHVQSVRSVREEIKSYKKDVSMIFCFIYGNRSYFLALCVQMVP